MVQLLREGREREGRKRENEEGKAGDGLLQTLAGFKGSHF